MENKEICKQAIEVREKYGLMGTAINPLTITLRNRIKVLEKSNLTMKGEPVSGAIIKDGDDITIYVNAEDSKTRKRFTIAHELGHYYLHLDKNKQFVDLERSNNKDSIEMEADEFAGCLLMDENEIKSRYKMAKDIGLNEQGILNVLSMIFSVSTAAVYTRLRRLGIL